jgi:hypothetical protein
MNKFTLLVCFCLLLGFGESIAQRNILQNEAKEIGIEQSIVKDFSELNLPTYQSRACLQALEMNTSKVLKAARTMTGLLLKPQII